MKAELLGRSYEVLRTSIPLFPEATPDRESIDDDIENASSSLQGDFERFEAALAAVEAAVKAKDDDEAGNKFVRLRGYAINIATEFSNLADAIEQVAFTESED